MATKVEIDAFARGSRRRALLGGENLAPALDKMGHLGSLMYASLRHRKSHTCSILPYVKVSDHPLEC